MNIENSKLKNIVREACSSSGVLCRNAFLFGSRGRGDGDDLSDYDILIIVSENISTKLKHSISKAIRTELASHLVGADIIIVSDEESEYFKDKTGSIVKSALAEGLVL